VFGFESHFMTDMDAAHSDPKCHFNSSGEFALDV
jgi:hypothetical protein